MRKVSILLFLAGLLIMGGVVSAQDTAPVFCGSLAEADCTILQQSRTAMQGLTSADFSLNFDFTAENIPDMPTTEPLTVSLTGAGSFSGDIAAAGQPPTDTSDPSVALTYLADVLANASFKLDLTINIPPTLAAMSGSSSIPSTIPINVVLVNGEGYLDFDALAPVVEASGSDTSSMPQGWVGINLVEAINQFAPMMAQMASMATQEAGSADLSSLMQDPTVFNQYLTIERGPDANGEAVFNTTIDLAGLLNDPTFQGVMQQQAEMAGGAQAEQGIAMASMMANSMDLTVTETIGLSDNFVHSVTMDFTFDMSALMSAMSSESTASADTQAPPVVKVHFDYALSNFNSAAAITVPEGATLIPLEQLMGGSMGSDMDSDMEGMEGLDSMMEGMDSMMEPSSSG